MSLYCLALLLLDCLQQRDALAKSLNWLPDFKILDDVIASLFITRKCILMGSCLLGPQLGTSYMVDLGQDTELLQAWILPSAKQTS